jgi:hypothetical protein
MMYQAYVQQPIYHPMHIRQPGHFFPNRTTSEAERLQVSSVRWGRVVRVLGVVLLLLGALSLAAGIVRLAKGHGLKHVTSYLHLVLSLFMMCTGFKGIRAAQQTNVNSAKRYLCSVSVLSAIVIVTLVVGIVLMATHTKPKDIKLSDDGLDTADYSNASNVVVGSDQPNLLADAPQESSFLEKSRRPAAGEKRYKGHGKGKHSSTPALPHQAELKHHAHKRGEDSSDSVVSNESIDAMQTLGGYEPISTHHKSKHHHGRKHQAHFAVAALISTLFCSVYLFSAVKLVRARKALKKLSRQSPAMPQQVYQPQYQVSQAPPSYYGSPIYQAAPQSSQA